MFKSVKESTRNELLIDKVMIIKSSLQIREFYNLFLEIVHIYLIVYVHIYLNVYTHTQANFNVGNSKEKLLAILSTCIPWIGYPRTLNAWAIVDEVTKE